MLAAPAATAAAMHRFALALLFLPALLACQKPAPAATADAATVQAPDVIEADIASLQQAMAKGTLTSQALVQAYLARIAAIDDAGPTLNAVIEVNPDAYEDAAALDAERKAGRVRGPLHGIPVLLKDNIDARPMVNSAGSLAMAQHRPQADAFMVARLRDAGAVILGKTNLSEWANFRGNQSSSGWSSRGGQTLNPYALDRSPCGSSSGTGSAIAASLASVGIGTETDGSIICPAAVAGLVGIKPTVGLVSRSGVIPIAASQDTPGPMARTVADAAALLGVIAGNDPSDTHGVLPGRPATPPSYSAGLRRDALAGARIGVLRDNLGKQPDVDAAFERALATLKAQGAVLVDARIPTAGRWNDAEFQVLLYEFKDGLNRYLAANQAPVRDLAALIAWNSTHASQVLPHFGQELLEQAQAKGPLSEPAYLKARADARRLAGPEGIDAALAAQRLDALVAPAMSPPWKTDHARGDAFSFAGYGVAAVAGTPSITVPMGDAAGLPLGLVFLGPAWSEAKLIGLAYAFEQASQARKPPRFAASAALAR